MAVLVVEVEGVGEHLLGEFAIPYSFPVCFCFVFLGSRFVSGFVEVSLLGKERVSIPAVQARSQPTMGVATCSMLCLSMLLPRLPPQAESHGQDSHILPICHYVEVFD